MTTNAIFTNELYNSVLHELFGECRLGSGFASQKAGSDATSPSTTAIVGYSLERIGVLPSHERQNIIDEILGHVQKSDGYYKNSIGNEGSVTVWSTAQSILGLLELGVAAKDISDSIIWLCSVQKDSGGWSFNGKDDVEKIGYSLYAMIVLSRVRYILPGTACIEESFQKSISYIQGYKPTDVCEELIQYYLQIKFGAEKRDRGIEREILMQLARDNAVEIRKYASFEPRSGERHFYVPWYSPSFYLMLRILIGPDHPVSLMFIRWLRRNVKKGADGYGWTTERDVVYTWTTALSLLTIDQWNKDCEANRVNPEILNDEKKIDRLILEISEGTYMSLFLNVCPMNGGICNQRKEIEAEYNDKNVFLDIPYSNPYKTFEKQIIETVKKIGLNPMEAKEKIKSQMLLCKICHTIQTCKYGIADISEDSLNIPFELGLMYGLEKHCVILKNKNADQPSDIQGLEYQEYENTDEVNDKLKLWFKCNI